MKTRISFFTGKIGMMLISGTLMLCACPYVPNIPDDPTPPAEPVITSGRVNTLNKFSFRYGRMDVSAKLPQTANGLWPAVWMMGDDVETVGWPECSEIDIVEMGSRDGINEGTQDRFLTRGAHWGPLLLGNGHPNYMLNDAYPKSLQDDFHLYTLVWDERVLQIYIDPELDANLNLKPGNTPCYEMLINVYDGDYPVGKYFHKPDFIIMNLAVGGNFPQIHDINQITALHAGNNYEATMYVDFVRVFRHTKTNTSSPEEGLVWQDLFDGDRVDENKWNIEENDDGGGNNELQSYRRANVSVGKEPTSGKSCLILKAKKE
ncbi:MAG: family 16 glycosylhydrolase [Tannerellaceae bacterium]|jgi:beta-glucanase (GH16 family)|nr:family 16 glycosylhydrolase [Tannerellaceae bacterium]